MRKLDLLQSKKMRYNTMDYLYAPLLLVHLTE